MDRGGPRESDVDPTPIAHFRTKFNIEKHLLAVAGKMDYTIIRPVGFMDNFTPDYLGAAMSSILRLNGETTKFQLVSTKNIGDLAGLAFQKREDYAGQCISFAGDILDWKEMNELFKKVTGSQAPTTYGYVASILRWMLKIQMDWFRDYGFKADVEDCRQLLPDLLSFEDWLRQESNFSKVVHK